MHVFKRKAFQHWQKHQRIHDSALCRTIKEMESGLIKGDRSTITQHETRALQYAGRVFLNLDPEALFQALNAGVLIKVDCDEQTH